jgi:hypothetical protein
MQSGVIAVKFGPSGSLVYSTWLGTYGYGYGIAVDATGNAFITGYTYFSDQVTSNAYQKSLAGGMDAFVAKLNPSGNGMVYFTYLGGASNDYARSIAIDKSGSAHIAGYTNSNNFPTANPLQSNFGSISGVYQTMDGGSNWILGNNGLPTNDIGALAADPATPSLIYAGVPGGVYKSSNGGVTWTQTGAGRVNVKTLWVNPGDSANIYAGATAAVSITA